MALIALLNYEEKIQVDDKTRLDASQSFASRGSSPITVLTIKPEASASAISVFNSTIEQRYLDWVYTDTTFDIDETCNKIYFSESGSDKIATIPVESYTRTELIDEIETQMNAAGYLDYTTTEEDNKLKIFGSGQFILQGKESPSTNLLPHVGFKETTTAAATQTSDPFEYAIKKITVTVGDSTLTATKNFYVKVFSVQGDLLFASDNDLRAEVADILKYVERGRASFVNVHRQVQSDILDWLDQNQYRDQNGKRLKKWAILKHEEIKNWAKYAALRMIFFNIHNEVDDVFKQKSNYFKGLEEKARSRLVLTLDDDGSNEQETETEKDTGSGRLLFR
jgi:hypothetical protein